MNLKGSKTEQNLLKTFAGESRARNMYNLFGEKARKDGYQYIGQIFDMTAENEKAHAREVYGRFLGMIKSTLENLRTSSEAEAYENTTLYKQFEEDARKEGFTQIADFYGELREVEESHMNRFKTIANNLEDGNIFKRDTEVKWQCMNCGYIHIGKEAPMVCPLCKYPKSYFKIYCEDYK